MKQHHDADYSLEHVASSGKKNFWAMLVVMLGFTFFSASMWSGGELGIGLNAKDLLIAVFSGNLILGVYTSLLAYMASKTGLSTHLLARYSFGEKGSFLASFLLGITQVGWFGVGIAMFALPVQKATGWDIYTIIALAGFLMTATAWFGIRALTILSFIAVPAITILGTSSVLTAFQDFGGIAAWLSLSPDNPMPMYTSIGICVASFISGGTLAPDFTRFSRTGKIAVSTTVIAFFVGNTLMFFFGAVGAAFYKQADISDVMLQQGMIVWAMLILGLNIWTTNDNALYASGLGFSNITKLPKRWLVTFNGLLGTLLALYLYHNFIGWLSLLNTTLPAIGGVLIADFYLLNKRSYKPLEEHCFTSIRWTAIISWGVGVLAARFLPGIAPINGVVATILLYYILEKSNRLQH